jgi:hypothetical protein
MLDHPINKIWALFHSQQSGMLSNNHGVCVRWIVNEGGQCIYGFFPQAAFSLPGLQSGRSSKKNADGL